MGTESVRKRESGKAIGFFTFHFSLFTLPFLYTRNMMSICAMITLTNMPRGYTEA